MLQDKIAFLTCARLNLQPTSQDGENSDALPPPDEDSRKCQRILLKSYKRRREAIIRFHRFNQEEARKIYRSKLMLYMPWRD